MKSWQSKPKQKQPKPLSSSSFPLSLKLSTSLHNPISYFFKRSSFSTPISLFTSLFSFKNHSTDHSLSNKYTHGGLVYDLLRSAFPQPAMETFQNQRGWVPVEDKKDCSHGSCTILCPQWCYILFPPPPFALSEDDESSRTTFSPLVISIIGILGAAFLLISYYTVVTKYSNASLFRRWGPSNHDQQEEESVEQSQRHESWHLPPTNGLDEAIIAKITVYGYKTGEGLVDGTDCSVCLAEFREGESLRLLPKCRHAFHLQCIDTWLKSHLNCPLCRANIVVQNSDLESRVASAADHEQESIVVLVDDLDLERNGEEDEIEEIEVGSEGSVCKDVQVIDVGDDDDMLLRSSVSIASVSQDRIFSIAHSLQQNMEDEYVVGASADTDDTSESARGGGGENSKGRSRDLHSVISPVRMKRSVSSGKTCFVRKGRGGVHFFCFEEEQQKSDGEEASSWTSSE